MRVAHLPRYISSFETKSAQLEEQIDQAKQNITAIQKDNATLLATITTISAKHSLIEKIDNRLLDLQHRIEYGNKKEASTKRRPDTVINASMADNHSFDNFYKQFEDVFRGTEESIKERVTEHIDMFKALPTALKKLPVVDLGCGRGEFLSVLSNHKFNAIGVDMNVEMVERVKSLGFTAHADDARSYLRKQPAGSLAAVTGFHIVEHIPFESLMAIFSEAYRAVARGGFVLFETPNPKSLLVGANTFYLDPSHQRPIPPELLAFMLEYVGFTCETIPLHHILPPPTDASDTILELHETVFGFADYAVVGKKL